MRPITCCVVLGLTIAGVPSRAFAQASVSEPAASAARETAGTPKTDHPPIAGPSFVKSLGGDFRHLFSPDNTRIAMIFGSAALAARTWDASATRELSEISPTFSVAGNLGGGLWMQLGASATTFAVGKVIRQPRMAALGSDLLRAQLVTQTIVQGIKVTATRTRPDGSSDFSFPSGHTASAFATATVLQRNFGWKAGIPAYAFGGYVASSRMASNKHFLSDVIVGAATGIVVGRTVTVGSGRSRFAVAVAPTGGGAALTFTKKP